MKGDFEFDKIAVAIAVSVFLVIFSNALGGFIYRTQAIVEKRGYQIEIVEASDSGAPKGLPDVIDVAAVFAGADTTNGQKIFNKCAVCHTIGKGESNKVGPNLWGIVGSKSAHKDDFKYSDAMSQRSKDGKVWGFEELYRYIYSPKAYIPGNKMAFAGVKEDKDRRDLIAYLNQNSDSPLPLPKGTNPPAGASPAKEAATKK